MSQAALESTNPPDDSPAARLRRVVAHAAHYLPTQGPIQVFIHHNTLHAFEDQPFHKAVRMGQRMFGGEPYPSEQELRRARATGRITTEDVEAVLALELRDALPAEALAGGLLTRSGLRRLVLERPIETARGQELRWHLVERGTGRSLRPDVPAPARERINAESLAWLRDALSRGEVARVRKLLGAGRAWELRPIPANEARLRADLERDPEGYALAALWNASLELVEEAGSGETLAELPSLMHIHRDVMLERTGLDTRELVNPLLSRWVAAFLDQGLAYWPMPNKQRGLLRAVRSLYGAERWLAPQWLTGLSAIFEDQEAQDLDAAHSALESLTALGVAEAQWDSYIVSALRGLPGWAGLVRVLEATPTLAPHACPPASLLDFLALHLTLERLALEHLAREHAPDLAALDRMLVPGRTRGPGAELPEARAYRLFQVLQLAGLAAPAVLALSTEERAGLVREVDRLDDVEIRRLLFLAYERKYRQEVLGAVAEKQRRFPVLGQIAEPRFQFAFCIDEREESIRRHIEELSPDSETLAIAGFFGVAVAFQGLDDPHPVDLCPMGVQPRHVVKEVPDVRDQAVHESRKTLLRRMASVAFGLFVGSRAFLRGWVATLVLGGLAMVPLTTRVFLPGWVARFRHRLAAWFLAPPRTDLTMERTDPTLAEHGRFLGYTVEEMLDGVERTLGAAGLTRNFASLVFILGHGSTSLNNPHESAHDCGACGGHRGAPNARLFARFANHPLVRSGLAARGIAIPGGTWFVGGCHDTCSDAVDLFDLDRVPAPLQAQLAEARKVLDEARARNAHERCRRFESVPLDVEPPEALERMEARSEDLSEPRPEYGHATNACAFIGRRQLSRGLFYDRRAFMVSYDATQDPSGEILQRILTPLVPVAAGISLEYYFSRIDSEGYGCGTKLPHNVTGLLGVVNGHGGDILTGLPWQMVEVHEPMRLVTVLEADPAVVGTVVARIPHVLQCVVNEWVQVACVHPVTREISLMERGTWVPFQPSTGPLPVVSNSRSWFAGRRDFASPAIVNPASAGS